MVRRKGPNGQDEIVEDQRAPLVDFKIGGRHVRIGNLGKGIVALVVTGGAVGAIVGTVMHIVGWDFVSVRGQELREVKHEIAQLDTGQMILRENQRLQRAELDTLKQEARRQSRYQCYIIRRTNPELLEADDPCQPVRRGRR